MLFIEICWWIKHEIQNRMGLVVLFSSRAIIPAYAYTVIVKPNHIRGHHGTHHKAGLKRSIRIYQKYSELSDYQGRTYRMKDHQVIQKLQPKRGSSAYRQNNHSCVKHRRQRQHNNATTIWTVICIKNYRSKDVPGKGYQNRNQWESDGRTNKTPKTCRKSGTLSEGRNTIHFIELLKN